MIGYKVEIVGSAPGLVMNSPAGMSSQQAKVPKPADEAEAKAYRLSPSKQFRKGELCLPGEMIMACLLKTASNVYKFKLGGKAQTVKGWLAGTAVINPSKVGIGTEDYEVYVVPAVVQRNRVMRARPRIAKWEASFTLQFSEDDPIYADVCNGLENIMLEMFRMAGVKTGLGDNRPSAPSKPGPHGRFTVRRCELIS